MRALKLIGSWWTAVLPVLALAGVYVYLAFGETPYPLWHEFVYLSAPGILIHTALIANLLAASAIAIISRRERPGLSAIDVMAMDVSRELHADAFGPDVRASVRKWLAERGFRSAHEVGDAIYARKGVYAVAIGIVLRVSLAVLLAGLMISAHTRQSASVNLAMGETGNPLGYTVLAGGIDAPLPVDFLQVGDSSIFRMGSVTVDADIDGTRIAITSGQPVRARGAYWRVTHAGYSQPAVVDGRQDRLLLDVLPPGGTCPVELQAKSGQVYTVFSLAPERTVKKGLLSGRMYNLGTPRYEISLRGRSESGVMIRSTESGLLDNVRIQLGKAEPFIRLTVVKDPALWAIKYALLLALAFFGLLLARLFWYESRIVAIMEGGSVRIGYSEEFYKKYGIYKFNTWLEKLEKRDLK